MAWQPNLPRRNYSPEITNLPEFLIPEFPDFPNPSIGSSFNDGFNVFNSVTKPDSLVYSPIFSDKIEIPAIQTMDSGCYISGNVSSQFLQEPLLLDSTPNFGMGAGIRSSSRHQVTELWEKNDGFVPDCLRIGSTGYDQAIHGDSVASIEESLTRARRYSIEEKKERIRRYQRKRNRRNFNKIIKYECRKTLANGRPRVRGRFARNDELGEDVAMARMGGGDEENDNAKVSCCMNLPEFCWEIFAI